MSKISSLIPLFLSILMRLVAWKKVSCNFGNTFALNYFTFKANLNRYSIYVYHEDIAAKKSIMKQFPVISDYFL